MDYIEAVGNVTGTSLNGRFPDRQRAVPINAFKPLVIRPVTRKIVLGRDGQLTLV